MKFRPNSGAEGVVPLLVRQVVKTYGSFGLIGVTDDWQLSGCPVQPPKVAFPSLGIMPIGFCFFQKDAADTDNFSPTTIAGRQQVPLFPVEKS